MDTFLADEDSEVSDLSHILIVAHPFKHVLIMVSLQQLAVNLVCLNVVQTITRPHHLI